MIRERPIAPSLTPDLDRAARLCVLSFAPGTDHCEEYPNCLLVCLRKHIRVERTSDRTNLLLAAFEKYPLRLAGI
jgi:hypothetical protein